MHMAEEQWLILVRIRCAEVRLEKGFSKRAGSHDYTGVLFDEKKYILDLLSVTVVQILHGQETK